MIAWPGEHTVPYNCAFSNFTDLRLVAAAPIKETVLENSVSSNV